MFKYKKFGATCCEYYLYDRNLAKVTRKTTQLRWNLFECRVPHLSHLESMWSSNYQKDALECLLRQGYIGLLAWNWKYQKTRLRVHILTHWHLSSAITDIFSKDEHVEEISNISGKINLKNMKLFKNYLDGKYQILVLNFRS